MLLTPTNPSWPDTPTLMKALTHWCKLRPRSIRLTVNMKLITKSRWRENALLEAHRTVTQIQHELLLELEEDPAQYEAGRAFDVITTALCALRDNDKGKITQIISNMLYTRFKKRFDATTYPVIGTLKLGAYRRCSLMVLLWYYDVVRYLTKHNPLFASDQKSDESVPIRNSRAVYDAWSSAHATYKAACNVTIPFGYYREKRLDQVNKRDLRRLRKQLPPEKVIDQTLIHIDVLLRACSVTKPLKEHHFYHVFDFHTVFDNPRSDEYFSAFDPTKQCR